MLLPPSQVENDFEADIPPPNIRREVDTTAKFVASVNPWFEKRMIADKSGIHKYSFVYDADPYNAYYKRRVSEFRAQNGSTQSADGDDPFRPKWLTKLSEEQMRENANWYKRIVEVIAAGAISVVSPITGDSVPAEDMYQHMQLSVADPKYKEQKERLFAKIREIAPRLGSKDDIISVCVAGVAQTRPDVFGATEEEFLLAVKAEFESIGIVSPSLPQPHMLSPRNAQCSTPPMPPLGMPEEPEPKRQRLDDSMLVPEDQFLAQHPGPVCISVWVPEKGRMLKVSMESSSESVSSLKEKIAGAIKVPAGKQKLSGKAPGFFMDNLSLAHYNAAGGEKLSLSW